MTRRQINRISVWLLALGLAAAVAIFCCAAPAVENAYDPLASKKYLQEIRRIGGTGNEVAAEIDDWFASIWHGRALAGTVAVLTIGATLGFRFVAMHPDYLKEEQTEQQRAGRRDGPP